MYIPEFWVGVGCTLLSEVVITIIAFAIDTHKKKKR